jgi:hypothetical protein
MTRSSHSTQPQRRLGRLHRLVDHGQQLGGEGVQVGLPAQPAERLDCAGGVVAAPVHGLLGPFGGKEGVVGASSVGLGIAFALAAVLCAVLSPLFARRSATAALPDRG